MTPQLDTKPWDHTRPDPRNKSIGHFTDVMNDPVPEITAEQRELVCNAIDKRGFWHTDLPEMLGLVERPKTRLCPQGHDQADHGGVRGDGRKYCLTCKRDQERARYQRSKATA